MSERQTSGNATPAGYERTTGNGPMGGHPQLQKVIDAILSGESCNSISRWVSPPVTRFTVSKLAHQVREQQRAALLIEQAKQLQANPQSVAIQPQSVAELTRNAVLGQQHLSRIREHQDRTSRLLVQAEENGDIGSVATLIKTDYQGIRLAAELDGSLALAIGPQVTVNSQVIVLPQFGGEDMEPAIDVPSERV